MGKYYIRISDEEPVDMKKGIRFKYDGNGSEAEFTIVEDEFFSELVEQFDMFTNDFSRAVNYNLENLLASDDKTIAHSNDTKYITNDGNTSSISYQDIYDSITLTNNLSSRMTSAESSISNKVNTSDFQNFANSNNSSLVELRNLLNNKASSQSVEELSSNVSSISNSVHDTGWIDITSFQSGVKGYSTHYKPQVRRIGKIVSIRGALTRTSTYQFLNLGDGFACSLPDGFAPKGTINFLKNGSSGAYFLLQINNSGEVGIDRYMKNGSQIDPPKDSWLTLDCTYFIG